MIITLIMSTGIVILAFFILGIIAVLEDAKIIVCKKCHHVIYSNNIGEVYYNCPNCGWVGRKYFD